MIDLKQYGYIEAETPPIGLITGKDYRTTARAIYRHHRTERSEGCIEGRVHHNAGTREDFRAFAIL